MKKNIKLINVLPYMYIAVLFAALIPCYDIIGWVKMVLLTVIFTGLEIRYGFLKKCLKKNSEISVVLSFITSFFLMFQIHVFPYWQLAESFERIELQYVVKFVFVVLIAFIIYPAFNLISSLIFSKSKINKRKICFTSLVSGVLFFTLFIYLPSETYINNLSDYNFPYQSFAGIKLIEFIVYWILYTLVVSFLKNKLCRCVYAITWALNLCIYIQYMFMNHNLIFLDGESMVWDDYTAFSVITLGVWILILAISLLFEFKYEVLFRKISKTVLSVIGGLQLISLCLMIVISGNKIFKTNYSYMSKSEQFVVSENKNVIMFILDAVDNLYFEELMKTNPELFDEFKDFTFYKNTCSVFDSTPTSISQMLTGMDFSVELTGEEWYYEAWHGARANAFFERFHQSDYIINGYTIASNTAENYEGKFDNYQKYIDTKNNISISVNYQALSKDFDKLSLYRALPFIFKRFIGMEYVDFNGNIHFSDSPCYLNNDFDNNLDLRKSENNKNYFVVQHLRGTHPPVDDAAAESAYLLKIMQKYIIQLKKLGVYDDTALIITSDHGMHNDSQEKLAAVPILMTKRIHENGEAIKISNAPVYHEDIQSTLLDCAGLYNGKTDLEQFGRSVFDIQENENRERTWYDRRHEDSFSNVNSIDSLGWAWDGCNAYFAYTYAGDADTLRGLVESGEVTHKYHMTDNKG